MNAPSGRTAYATENASNAKMNASVGLSPAKNFAAMTGYSEPNIRKLYHSNTVPSDAPKTTLRSSGVMP